MRMCALLLLNIFQLIRKSNDKIEESNSKWMQFVIFMSTHKCRSYSVDINSFVTKCFYSA